MTVQELNSDQLEQLKWDYFYDDEVEHDFEFPYKIPNSVIFEHFAHISFVEEDFSSDDSVVCDHDFIPINNDGKHQCRFCNEIEVE
jgi:hypothetical protein